MKVSLRGRRKLLMATLFVALASSLRLFKHVFVGSIQFVNFPAIFTILGGLMFGCKWGAFIGVMSFLVSDFIIGFAGFWTIFTSLSMGLVGILSGFLNRLDADSSLLSLSVCSYLLILIYDILSSLAGQIFFLPFMAALTWSIVGLFLPGPAPYPVGLVTEIVSTALIVFLYPQINRLWKEVKY